MDEEKAATRESCARSSLASLAKLTVVPAMKLVSRGNPLSSWLFCHTILLAFLSDASALTSSPYLVAIIAIHSPLRSLSSAWPSASRFPGYDGRKNREMLSKTTLLSCWQLQVWETSAEARGDKLELPTCRARLVLFENVHPRHYTRLRPMRTLHPYLRQPSKKAFQLSLL